MEDQAVRIVAVVLIYPRANAIFASKINTKFSECIETVKVGWRHSFLAYLGIYSLCIH